MLVTNGCSFVWGDELYGFMDTPPQHHHLTFSHHLAQKLELPYKNLSICGNGNDKIFRDTTRFLRVSETLPTHVVILWTHWQREEMAQICHLKHETEFKIQRFHNMSQFSPLRLTQLPEPVEKAYRNLYTVYDPIRTKILHTLTYMTHMQWLCESLGIKLIQGVMHKKMRAGLSLTLHPANGKGDANWSSWMGYVKRELNYLKETSKVGIPHFEDMYSMGERLGDMKTHGHPGEETHKEYAELLYNIFRSKFED
jgi:hypothetical protein